jgi:hypothetical protein
VLRVQATRPSGVRAFAEGFDAAAVVLGDPVLDRAERTAQAPGDVGCGPPLLGQEDGLDSLPGPLPGDGVGQDLELVQAVMFGDEHG